TARTTSPRDNVRIIPMNPESTPPSLRSHEPRATGRGRLPTTVRWLAFQLLFLGLVLAACSRERDAAPHVRPRFSHVLDVAQFQRGNLHTHTSASDGDAPPAEVIRWYKAHGYAF